jgi:hypothetical protein
LQTHTAAPRSNSASRALCRGSLNSEGDTRDALLDALEKVDPSLLKHLVTLLVDKAPTKHVRASQAIGKLEGGGAAVPILLAHAPPD